MATQHQKKICLNASCKREFVPGHYGNLQRVCSGTYNEKCYGRKKSEGCPGKKCKKCHGKGSYKETCQNWYKHWWAQTRKPPRGMPEPEQLRALGAALKKRGVRFWALLVTARTSAMRKGELLGITWSDVEDGVKVRSNFPLRGQWDDRGGFKATKTGSGRSAYLLKDARQAIAKLRATEAKKDQLGDRIWPYTEVEAWRWWNTLQRSLKISNPETGRPFRFHDLRHCAAIRTLKRTGKLSDVSELCGHKNPATSQIYTTPRPEDFAKSIE